MFAGRGVAELAQSFDPPDDATEVSATSATFSFRLSRLPDESLRDFRYVSGVDRPEYPAEVDAASAAGNVLAAL